MQNSPNIFLAVTRPASRRRSSNSSMVACLVAIRIPPVARSARFSGVLSRPPPFGERADEARFRRIVEHGDELERVAVRIAKVKLRRRHPTDDRRLSRFFAHEVARRDACVVESFAD